MKLHEHQKHNPRVRAGDCERDCRLHEGLVRVTLDDSIIANTTAEKKRDANEVVACLIAGWEHRAK